MVYFHHSLPSPFCFYNFLASLFLACACLSTVPKKTVVAQFDYAAYSPNELALEAGDVLEVLDKRADGWWRGRCKGREGMFPASFIVELETDEPITADASPESILLEENNAGGNL